MACDCGHPSAFPTSSTISHSILVLKTSLIYVLKLLPWFALYPRDCSPSLSSSFSISVSLQQQTKNPQKSTNLLPNCILHSSYLLSLPRRARGRFSTAIALPIEFNIQWIPFATYMRRISTWIGLISNCPNWSPSTSIPHVLWANGYVCPLSSYILNGQSKIIMGGWLFSRQLLDRGTDHRHLPITFILLLGLYHCCRSLYLWICSTWALLQLY